MASQVNDPFLTHTQTDARDGSPEPQYGSMEQQDDSGDQFLYSKGSSKRPGSKMGGIAILVGLPFTVFALIFSTYIYSALPVVSGFFGLLAVGCSLFCIIMDRNNRRKWWFYVGCLSLAAAFFGWIFGLFVYTGFMRKYLSMTQQTYYSNVLPSELADAHRDAGVIQFATSATVDISKSAGFKDNSLFCVAPIMTPVMSGRVEYWAVGIDCCDSRGKFTCDDALDVAAREGIIQRNHGFLGDHIENNFERFSEAVALAEAAYDLTSASDPIFVRWVKDSESWENSYHSHAVVFTVFISVGYFALSTAAGLFCHNVWKRSLD